MVTAEDTNSDDDETSLLADSRNFSAEGNVRRTNSRLLSNKLNMNFANDGEPEDGLPKSILIRNLVAFWLLGLCNNYAYVIMLSAAHDILGEEGASGNDTDTSGFNPDRDCSAMSTGAILLADILPSVIIKIIAPFFLYFTFLQVSITIILSLLSFIAVAFANASWLTYTGVAFASLSSGLGETTLLRYSTAYTKNVISTWSSGTGMSGVLGSFSYAAITSTGLSPRDTLLTMTVIPVLMAVSYFIILVHPNKMMKIKEKIQSENIHQPVETTGDTGNENTLSENNIDDGIDYDFEVVEDANKKEVLPLTYKNMFLLIVPLLKFMIPLSLVYMAEYFINQGLVELIYFRDISISHDEQYRWYQVLYQIGVFISRSSVNFFQIEKLWILPILQFINVIIFVCEAYYLFIPSIWIVFVLILYEGLLGGLSYVNTFYKITQVIDEPYRAFSMGAASMGDSIGTSIAGAIAIPVHTVLCKSLIPS
ncbi:G1/S-specific cyclin cln3 [Chamberlinius hualienensis]